MHEAGPPVWLKFTERAQKNADGLREAEMFGRHKDPQEEKVRPHHEKADACFKGH